MTSKSEKSKSNLSESAQITLSTKEQIDNSKRKSLKAVELLLVNSVSTSKLIKACESLCQADYTDVIEERNIINLCGYPLCDTIIKIPSQKYHISYRRNKVYDITERKCYCSNECYKASKYLKAQLSPEPLWINSAAGSVNILSIEENVGNPGNEVPMLETLSEDTVDSELVMSQQKKLFPDFNEMLNDELGMCQSQLQNLQITEKLNKSETLDDLIDHKNPNIDEDDDDEHNISGPQYDPVEIEEPDFEDKKDEDLHEPEIEKLSLQTSKANTKPKGAVMIDPLPIKIHRPVMLMRKTVTPELAKHALKKWITIDALKYLFGEDFIHDFQSQLHKEEVKVDESKKLGEMQQGYVKMCENLDKLETLDEVADLKYFSDTKDSEVVSGKSEDKVDVKNENVKTNSQKKKQMRRKKKKVSFSADTKGEKPELSSNNDMLSRDSSLPNVDSLSQSSLRLQIVSGRLKVAFCSLLPLVGLHYKNISNDMRQLLSTLQFSANTITFKPDEWKLLALVFFRLLKEKSLVCNETDFSQLLKKSQFAEHISVADIDDIIVYICNPLNYH